MINIWSAGDIITIEKWNNIKNCCNFRRTYQLPIFLDTHKITINASYNEIMAKLKQGIICYFVTSFDEGLQVSIITSYNPIEKTLFTSQQNDIFFISQQDNTTMTNDAHDGEEGYL